MNSTTAWVDDHHTDPIFQTLLRSEDPSVKYRALKLFGGVETEQLEQLQEEMRASPRVRKMLAPLLQEENTPGVYAKFTGAHWVLADLADNGIPPGDEEVASIRERVCDFWLEPERTRERVVEKESARYKSKQGVPVINSRARRCASQEGNTLYASLALGFFDERSDRLAANLIRWQWPDGGWNCDRKFSAHTSSFHESLLPLRGLSWHARLCGSKESARAVDASCEFFLERSLFKRKLDGSVIHPDFLKLRYPHYWRYDILIALKVMAEAGRIDDPRCSDALDILEAKQLPQGGWRAEGKHYRVVDEPANGGSMVAWGEVSRREVLNEYVTLEALTVLKAAGRR